MLLRSSKGFTLVELIVVITILAILGTIGYISLLGYNVIARDTVRVSDITTIAKAVELSRLQEGAYPPISSPSDVTFSGTTIWTQGTFGKESQAVARRISEVPTDPLTGNEYAYSTTSSTLEYQVGAIVERSLGSSPTLKDITPFYQTSHAVEVNNILPDFLTTTIRGNYNGKYITHVENVSPSLKNIYILGVPSILSRDIGDTTLEQIHTNKGFVHEGGNNAPGAYSGTVNQKGWNFTPSNISGTTNPSNNIAVIYQGTNQDLSTDQGKINLVTNLKTYYQNTPEVIDSPDFTALKNLDPSTQTNETLSFANTLLNTNHGGLSGEMHNIQESIVTQNTTPPSETPPVNCGLTDSDLVALNNWTNVTLFGEPAGGGEGPPSEGGGGEGPPPEGGGEGPPPEGGEGGGTPNIVGNASPGTGTLTKTQWCSITNFSLANGYTPKMTSIPEAFYKLPNLTTIAFNDQNISQLSDSIVNFTNLTSITFTGNTGLGNLNNYWWGLFPRELCQDNITPTGKRICVSDVSRPISITVTESSI